jgi:AcrR family transcriptional regulator
MSTMPYPNKITRLAVIDAALALVEGEGPEALTLRRLAGNVGVTANALYRYFDSRDDLLAASTDAVIQRLIITIANAMSELPGDVTAEARVRRLLAVYSHFAQSNPALYRTFLSPKDEAGANLPKRHAHERLWDQCLEIIEPLVGPNDAPSATVSIWGLLHGLWTLRQAGVLGGRKPLEIDSYAFDVIIRGLSH